MATLNSTRRSVFTAMAVAPVVLAVPAMAAAPSAFAATHRHYRAAYDRFNGLPVDYQDTNEAAYDAEELRYIKAHGAMTRAEPTNWHEFTQAFEFACEDGAVVPTDEAISRLLGYARRLAAA